MKQIVGLLLVLLLSFWSVQQLLRPGYFPMHDDTQVARIIVMGKALRQGQFPVRWVSDLGYGYGYPIYNFYAPLPYYVGGGLYALGVDSLTATKTMFITGALLAGITLYLLLLPGAGIAAAVTGAIVFMYAPYHAVQIYIRGSVGEYWSVAFVPLLLLGLFHLLDSKHLIRGIVIGSIGLAGAVASHTILGFLTSALYGLIITGLFLLLALRRVTGKQLSAAVAILVLGAGLSAFFWIPALTEMKFTAVSAMVQSASTSFSDHFVCLWQLWSSPWGYAGSAAGCAADGMSFKLGKFHLLITVFSVGFMLYQLWKKKNKHMQSIYILGVFLFFLSVLGMLPISGPVWKILPYVEFIQYPWRLLAFSMLAVGLTAGYIPAHIRPPHIRFIAVVFITVTTIAVNTKLFRPQYVYSRDAAEFETLQDLRYRVSAISDEYLPAGIIKPGREYDIITVPVRTDDSHTTIHITSDSDIYLRAEVKSKNGAVIRILRAKFPGWQYSVNGVGTTPQFTHDLPSIKVQPGKTIIEVHLANTQARNIGNILSITAVFLIGGLLYYGSKTDA